MRAAKTSRGLFLPFWDWSMQNMNPRFDSLQEKRDAQLLSHQEIIFQFQTSAETTGLCCTQKGAKVWSQNEWPRFLLSGFRRSPSESLHLQSSPWTLPVTQEKHMECLGFNLRVLAINYKSSVPDLGTSEYFPQGTDRTSSLLQWPPQWQGWPGNCTGHKA